VQPGFNYRLDELRAALGSVQLARLTERNAARAEHVRRYRSLLQDVEGIIVPFTDDDEGVAHHLAVVVLPSNAPREGVRGELAERGIQTSVHYPPIHQFTAYADSDGRAALPNTDAIRDRILTLPLYPHMTSSDVDLVSEELVRAIQGAPKSGDSQG
jgi:dTDP-4-amino-4,6-dideoxygalactose transaminase